MARHPHGHYAQQQRRARNRTFIVLALLATIIVIAFMYGPFSADAENENKPLEGDTQVNATDPNTTADPGTIAPTYEVVTLAELPAAPVSDPNLSAIAVEPQPELLIEPNPEADKLIAEAAELISQGTKGYLEARDNLNLALRMPLSPQQSEYIKAQLSELSNRWLFSRNILPGDPLCENYQVKPGDIFEAIARKCKVPYEILMEINNISNPLSLQAGQSIKIIHGPFNAKVYRSTFKMDLSLQNTYVCSFTVGLGKPGYDTPTGLWRLRPGGKAHATTWRDPDSAKLYQPEDPDYPLGSRWMALEGLRGQAEGRDGFGIHGTKEPEQIGTASSRGCIRMYNGEAIKVYNMLSDGLSYVEVID